MATTRRKTEPVVWDSSTPDDDLPFDSWDETREEAAIHAAAEAADVKTIIVERTFAGRFPDGQVIRVPLDISVADLDAITAEADNPVDQVKHLFERIGDEQAAEALTKQGLTSAVIFAQRFFEAFQKVAQVALGKPSK